MFVAQLTVAAATLMVFAEIFSRKNSFAIFSRFRQISHSFRIFSLYSFLRKNAKCKQKFEAFFSRNVRSLETHSSQDVLYIIFLYRLKKG